MKTTIWYNLGFLALLAGQVGAEQAEPQDAVRDFANRLNNRWVDELVGPVDFEFVYFVQSNEAYPLAEVKAFQDAKRVEELPDGRTVFHPAADTPDSASAQAVIFDANGVQESPVLASGETGRGRGVGRQAKLATSRPGVGTPDTLVVPGGEVAVAATPEVSDDQRERRPQVYTRPFVQDPGKAVGPRPPKARYWGDRRGDPNSFDLSEVDVPALLSRPLPAYASGMGGMQLGIAMARPPEREIPSVTQIEREYSLAQRRIMRLDLQEVYSRIPSGAFLEVEVVGVEVKEREATAQVEWSFTDQPERKTSTSLVLHQVAEGWQIEKAWGFIEQIAASR